MIIKNIISKKIIPRSISLFFIFYVSSREKGHLNIPKPTTLALKEMGLYLEGYEHGLLKWTMASLFKEI